mmetsp:Transcript_2605/g.3605  ORF Transcript_2605/g.3605 Transcript_2605/m.3605 type:complete len:144 (+) Transcript_2605:144-575(+)
MLWHRPTLRSGRLLKDLRGVTMIITAQAKRESPQDVRKICEQFGMKHFWIELNGANQALLCDKAVLKYMRKRIRELLTILKENEEVALIHCAAGIHRTGSLGYTLLRLAANDPLNKEQAYAALKIMREDTWKGVGDWRIDLAE